jgi:spermidine/putrescine transport system substrate-binding protein
MKNGRSPIAPLARYWMLALLVVGGCLSGCYERKFNTEAKHGLANDAYPDPPRVLAPVLRMLVWPDTILDEVKTGFEKRYGVRVEITNFANNDEAYRLFVREPKRWDLLMVSQYMGDRLRRENLLQPVPRLNEYIYSYIDTSVLNQAADSKMQYFIPFDYSVLGISFNIERVAGFPREWSYLTNLKGNPYLFGRIALPDDMRYAMAVMLLYAGLDPSSTNPEDIARVKEILIRNVQEQGVRFVPDPSIQAEMIGEKSLLAITWSAEAANILRAKSNCRFLIPEGKSIMSVDGFSVAKESKCPETAALFIEYMLHPYCSLVVANRTLYASTNMRTMKFVDPFLINGPSCMLAPPGQRVHMKYLSGAELKMYEDAWAEIKRAQFDGAKVNLIPRL